jgi:phosphomannomutase
MTFDVATRQRIEEWLKGPFDADTKEEIQLLLDRDPKALSDAFFKELSFGTGGMRGTMGIGTNRINLYTIRKATQGLANYIKKQPLPENGYAVFIGYDTRRNSKEFARETARVLAGNGIRVLLTKEICPTPLVSFGCRHYGCIAAVMITASHNPPQYNGYKVYWRDGAQVVPPHDVGIMEEVAQVKQLGNIPLSETNDEIGEELDAAYLAHLRQLQLEPSLSRTPLKVVYSNLHGTGIRIIPRALKEWGYANVSLVELQKSADGNFPFASSPNPEEEKALSLGTEQLVQEQGDLFIATDPDADRMGIVALQDGKPVRLTGNQIACLSLHHICQSLKEKGEFPENGAFVKTIVTTELFRSIAESFGGRCIDVLTGFKYIAEQIGHWEASFDAYQYIYGAEESYGYLFGTFVRDKDAVSASCLIAEVAARAKNQNLSLVDRLHQIYRIYGVHRESLTNLSFSDSEEGMKQMLSLMHHLRTSLPQEIHGQKVVRVEDYLHGYNHLPPSDVLRFYLEDGTKLVIRPSGTEPKVKVYAEVVQKADLDLEKTISDCDKRLKDLIISFKLLFSDAVKPL